MSGFVTRRPGMYIEEICCRSQSIEGINTSTVAFLGEAQTGSTVPTLINSWQQFKTIFGSYFGIDKYLPYAVEGFFLNGGRRCYVCRVTGSDYVSALSKLETIQDISILYSPNAHAITGLTDALIMHCERLKRFVILDSLKGQSPSNVAKPKTSGFAALYYPWIYVTQAGTGPQVLVPAGGHVAGIYARSDIERGVHKAPANQEVKGAVGLEFNITSGQKDMLNPEGINCICNFAGRGILVWGARTLSSDPEWKYVNVRRLMTYLELSTRKGTQWVISEPNTEVTWARVKASVETFLMQAWRNGMLMGTKSQDAYFVSCDRTTMTQNDIDNKRLNILVGVAPIKPAEFMILHVSQTMVQP